MNRDEQILFLSATVKTERGRKIVRKGDALPGDALDGEAERLREQGALGVPPAPDTAPPADEADVLADALEEANAEEDSVGLGAYVEAANKDEVLERAEKEPELIQALIDAEGARKKPRSTLVAALHEKLGAPDTAPPADEATGDE
jgi:hypothetical protein